MPPITSLATLQRDWDDLSGSHHSVVHGWTLRQPALAGCFDLDDVLGAIRKSPDEALAALLREDQVQEHQDDCPIAARVILQTMLPKMIRMARSDPSASLEDYLSHLWLRIRTYPIDRRPRRIAANLALDTLKAVKAEHSRDVVLPEDHFASLDRPVATEVTAPHLLSAAVQLGVIDQPTRAVLSSVYAEGLTGKEAAERHQTSPAMIRWRCSRAVRKLAARAGELVA